MRLPCTSTTASVITASDLPSNSRAALIAVIAGGCCAVTSAVAAAASVSTSGTNCFDTFVTFATSFMRRP
jgi:DNA gyrase inhibitor GyrI